MKLNKCAIEFHDNPLNVYYSGQTISGIVKVTLIESKKFDCICAKIIGTGYVNWTEKNGESTTTYEDKEIFYDKQIDLIHESHDTIQLNPGSYNFIFQYKLPESLPSSIEYTYGYIRYKMYAAVDDRKRAKKGFEKPFTVIETSHMTPYMSEPLIVHKNTTFNLFCYLGCIPSDPLTIIAEIPTVGYSPRQTIDIHLSVNNKSNQPVVEFTVQLIQTAQFKIHASSKKKVDKIVLKQEYVPGCEAGDEREIDVNVVVPTVPANRNSTCSLIKIQYFIRIMASVPCCHSDPELCLPINIVSGSIPNHPCFPAWINPLANDFD